MKVRVKALVLKALAAEHVAAPYRKAIAGAVAAGGYALWKAWPDGITSAEWWSVLVAAGVGSGLVYIAPKNRGK